MSQIKGIVTTIKKLTIEDAAEVVKLRNNENYNMFLFQQPLTIEEQIQWIIHKNSAENEVNFKVQDLNNNFVGTISIYNIENKKGEFGRYIVKNPINAIEAELLLLKYCFTTLKMELVYCNTNINNINVWNQHTKLGFKNITTITEYVGTEHNIPVEAMHQQISVEDYLNFNYEKIYQLIQKFKLK